MLGEKGCVSLGEAVIFMWWTCTRSHGSPRRLLLCDKRRLVCLGEPDLRKMHGLEESHLRWAVCLGETWHALSRKEIASTGGLYMPRSRGSVKPSASRRNASVSI